MLIYDPRASALNSQCIYNLSMLALCPKITDPYCFQALTFLQYYTNSDSAVISQHLPQ